MLLATELGKRAADDGTARGEAMGLYSSALALAPGNCSSPSCAYAQLSNASAKALQFSADSSGGDGGESGDGGGRGAHASGSSATRSSHAPFRRPELLRRTGVAPKPGGHIHSLSPPHATSSKNKAAKS